jgi:hypothetical protein
MPKIKYIEKRFNKSSATVIKQANEIIANYTAQGYMLTLRQLYYQFVARDLLANNQANYNRLGSILNDARLAGLVDWNAIEDRTRNLRALPFWADPAEIVSACADQFRVDLWEDQPHRIEVWIEKDALVGVVERACHEFNAPYFSCRGYTSQSEMWGAAQRMIRRYKEERQRTIVLHFGDHDPSGIDMSRDIEDRIEMFTRAHGAGGCFRLERLALNMPQIEEYNPPPNFAKATDARFKAYQDQFGDESWELDALEPAVIEALVRDYISRNLDTAAFEEKREEQARHRSQLGSVAGSWSEVVSLIEEGRI